MRDGHLPAAAPPGLLPGARVPTDRAGGHPVLAVLLDRRGGHSGPHHHRGHVRPHHGNAELHGADYPAQSFLRQGEG